MSTAPRMIQHKDLINLRAAVEHAYTKDADIDMIWAHGTDTLALTYYAVVNTKDGSGAPYVPVTAVYGTPGGAGTGWAGMTLTPGTAVAHSYTARSHQTRRGGPPNSE